MNVGPVAGTEFGMLSLASLTNALDR